MKRKYSDRANWRRILEKRYQVRTIRDDDFYGYITTFEIIALRDPLMKTYGGRTHCVADVGYVWIQYFPRGARHVITAMYDAQGQIAEWYIDVCRVQGTTDHGVPWFDDLYLDVVIMPDGEWFLMDEDELRDAEAAGIVTAHEAELARREAAQLIAMHERGELLPRLRRMARFLPKAPGQEKAP